MELRELLGKLRLFLLVSPALYGYIDNGPGHRRQHQHHQKQRVYGLAVVLRRLLLSIGEYHGVGHLPHKLLLLRGHGRADGVYVDIQGVAVHDGAVYHLVHLLLPRHVYLHPIEQKPRLVLKPALVYGHVIFPGLYKAVKKFSLIFLLHKPQVEYLLSLLGLLLHDGDIRGAVL